MKTTHKEEIYIKQDPFTDQIFDDSSIFFDIETTGFSPAHTSCYLIGCAHRNGSSVTIDQFFAESEEEEELIIQSFLELIAPFKTIISFNGIGFDIPYLKAKCDQYSLNEHFRTFQYIDIFKLISKMKFLFKLENYKQKTIENFLGINRKDQFTGGDLINVYHDYVKRPDSKSCALLLLHNYEDVLGMTDLIPVLSYREFFQGKYAITETEFCDYTDYKDVKKREYIITMKMDCIVPKPVSCQIQGFYLTISKDTAKLRVPVYCGELHFFYPNYKDYYYLPAEDIAIHKSVASFVDKDFRQKAKASNCYTRKEGEFLPQLSEIMKPAFRLESKDAISYFDISQDFSSSDIMLRRYVDHILLALFPAENRKNL